VGLSEKGHCLSSNLGANVKSIVRRFIKNESGATAIEYGLIAAIVGVGLVAGLSTLKSNLNTTFETVGTKLTTGAQ
jgi:pilus assembly protein Flp/PilA